MKLKSSLILLGAAFTMLGCANASNEFSISKFYPLGPGCDITANKEDTITPNAYLDVAAGSPVVVVGFVITGAQHVAQQPVAVGQVQLEGANRNRPIILQQVVNYRLSKRVGATPKPYITNFTVPFSDNGEAFGPAQLLSPELGQALVDGLIPSSGVAPSNTIEDFVDINMDVEFKGEWSATKNSFTTGVMTYPVRAYHSNPGPCPNGFIKYNADPTTGNADVCSYVGLTVGQLAAPPVPACCTQMGPMGGPGC